MNVASCGLTSLSLPGVTLATLNISSTPIISLNVTNAGSSLKSLNVSNCTSLAAIYSIGNTNLTSIDLTTLSALTQFQGSYSGFTSINVSGNPLLGYLQFDNAPACTSLTGLTAGHSIAELYIDNAPVGNIDLSTQDSLVAVHATNCGMTSVNVSAAQGTLSALWAYDNTSLSSLNIGTNPTSLMDLRAYNCALTRVSIDAILLALNNAGNINGYVNLSGEFSESPTDGTGNTNIVDLEANGWTVIVNECTPVGYDVPDTLAASWGGDTINFSWNNIGYNDASVQVYVVYDNTTYNVPMGDTSVALEYPSDVIGTDIWVRLGDGCGSNWSAWATTTIVEA